MKRLIYVPMIHSPEIIRRENLTKNRWQTDARAEGSELVADRFWSTVQTGLDRFPVGGNYRFYVEGNTTTRDVKPGTRSWSFRTRPRETQIIDFGFIRRVGGIIQETEDPELHREAIDLQGKLGTAYKEFLGSSKGDNTLTRLVYAAQAVDDIDNDIYVNTINRDLAVAENIYKTLQEGETGFLFFGAGHDILTSLPRPHDIQIEILDESLVEIMREIGAEIGDSRKRGELMTKTLTSLFEGSQRSDPEQVSLPGSERRG